MPEMCEMPHGSVPCEFAYPPWWVPFIYIMSVLGWAALMYWLWTRPRARTRNVCKALEPPEAGK